MALQCYGPTGKSWASPSEESGGKSDTGFLLSIIGEWVVLYRLNRLSLVFGLLLCLVPNAAALAHAILETSQPAEGAAVPAGDIEIILSYNSRIDPARSAVTLTMAGKTVSKLTLTPGDAPNIVRSTAHLAAGKYVLHWQVLSLDGHITRGQVSFNVTGS
ncbi:MAG TPA: copper resistance CopC family protein [Dongiaceae bacterium]|nr:copper resistance CopC family protein [Dongiaceae bacterium]